MDIPDEAWEAFSVPVESFSWSFTDRYTHHSGLEAAAPHIARAAQVAVLRELKEKWGKAPPCCEWGGSEYYDVLARLAALEAGDD